MKVTKKIRINYTRFQHPNNKHKIYILNYLFIIMFVYNGYSQINKNGYNVFYYPNGEISSEGTLKNGQPDGYWKTYYESGVLKTEGKRKFFLLDSVWDFYHENGKIDIMSESSTKPILARYVSKIY